MNMRSACEFRQLFISISMKNQYLSELEWIVRIIDCSEQKPYGVQRVSMGLGRVGCSKFKIIDKRQIDDNTNYCGQPNHIIHINADNEIVIDSSTE